MVRPAGISRRRLCPNIQGCRKKAVTPEAKAAIAPQGDTKEIVTSDQALHIFGSRPYDLEMADLNRCLSLFEINKTQRIRHFMAQIAHESGGLRWLEEIASGDDYEGRDDLGNTQPGDGRRYKGAGAIQLTGRANYQKLADFVKDPKVMEGSAYVAKHFPFTSAAIWWRDNDMNKLCDRPDVTVEMVTRRVNGGVNGLSDRIQYYEKACEAIC